MGSDFEKNLERYADILVNIGLNVQAGQRLLVGMPNVPVPLEAVPLVRQIAAKAYRAGAPLVDVIWGDLQLDIIRLRNAPPDTFEVYPTWQSDGYMACIQRGDVVLSLHGTDPELYSNEDPEHLAILSAAGSRHNREANRIRTGGTLNWCAARVPTPGWAARVFPDLPSEEQVPALWDAIFKMCRVDQDDPLTAWQAHLKQLNQVADYLTARRYTALKFTAPGTDLNVGLPEGHVWLCGGEKTTGGVEYVANIPTEEVFSLPHRERVEGHVTASMPLNLDGILVKDFSMSFEAGRVTKLTAKQGESFLRSKIERDEGASMLGEVALVPHSSPISASGILFYNTLYDENAACHIALGEAYPNALENGTGMSKEELLAAGANWSQIHEDFMIGSGAMDVDGIRGDGSSEAVMRGGEWAFEV